MFGRRKSPVEEHSETGTEATEERADIVNSDDFVVLDHNTNETTMLNPPSYFTVAGAKVFLPYPMDPTKGSDNAYQRPSSSDVQTAIDGVPFKLGSNVLLEGSKKPYTGISTEEVMTRIKSFNWDEFEYSFELEQSIMKEFNTSEQNAT
ncbi:hypothetical protein Pcinc_015839 [Petrolisthes cinctipes]|uniref:UMA domain-containing protein n=1 Tax=Petrolisthes cinctipes TaxID=88211 RepID=A0AAE1K850_PETCI|nr:hypothetical protein Pcinc_029219 [Petrolisthes cinctipes]KAK3879608.1 hypothetical protein Pcinc_015839 [Petrolisthes cinctipes]